jgi:hypothetical protein
VKRNKLRAVATMLLVTLILLTIPAVVGSAAQTGAAECGAVGCGVGWAVGGGAAVFFLTFTLTPIAGAAAGAVFAA